MHLLGKLQPTLMLVHPSVLVLLCSRSRLFRVRLTLLPLDVYKVNGGVHVEELKNSFICSLTLVIV